VVYVILKVQDNVSYKTHVHGCTVAIFKEIHCGAGVVKRESLLSYHCLSISVPYKLLVEVAVFHTMLYIAVFLGIWLDLIFGNLCFNIPCSITRGTFRGQV